MIGKLIENLEILVRYHIVVRVDPTQSTSSDRIRVYVNGVQETDFAQQSIDQMLVL